MLGIEFSCNSSDYLLVAKYQVITPHDKITPPGFVDIMAPGGIWCGLLRVEKSIKDPEKRLIISPKLKDEGSLPYVLVELGATKTIIGINYILATCVNLERV